ncbi:aldose epimerase family protein [uncultured Tateyamaria sp.]|uniref:aldose epimerase family protein n=1 Tax=uncultured Tateyamaria sp. TaxID=455651 RepID=UPI0026287DD2|nr:aldose epimerase family protein [uncultured Tateyamaria sp.]
MNDTITLTSQNLRATFSPHGARLETLCFEGGPSLILHADSSEHPEWRTVYPGAIVGPIANRVRGGNVPIHGQVFQMPRNENGMTALHSGPDGLDQRIWDVIHQSNSDVQFRAQLVPGDGGLPGARTITVHYRLEAATLILDISAETDAPTPFNIAHHPYWRLGDAQDHRLQVNATHYLPVDDRNLPTGEIAPVAGTSFDHLSPKAPDPDVDHNFCIARQRRDVPEPVATLTGTDGLTLQIDSTAPGLQVYAGGFLPTLVGTEVKPGAGLALEPQDWPDSVNCPEFPDILSTPRRSFRQITRYRLFRAT